MKWLQEQKLENKMARKLLQKVNRYLVTFIVKPLIKHFYQPVRSIHGYQITFVQRNVWHSFQDKAFNELRTQGYLKLCDSGNATKSRGLLKITPKSSCEILQYRVLVSANKKSKTEKIFFMGLAKKINAFAEKTSVLAKGSLYYGWKSYINNTKSNHLYGVKMDLQDAFGNVDINLLCDIIQGMSFQDREKRFLLHHIRNQYVIFKKQLFKWEHGLLQGDNLSSSLCNLYITYLESKCILKYKSEDNFIYRVVDDYLFCSLKFDHVIEFKHDIEKIFPFNQSKTQQVLWNTNYELNFCGQTLNLQSREISRNFHFNDIPLRYKFKLWNIKKPISENNSTNFILECLQFKTNNFYFKPIELNTSFNSAGKVLCNYFESMIFIAYKFDIVIKSLVEYRKTAASIPQLTSIIKKVIFIYAKICAKKIRRHRGKYYSEEINIKLLFQIGLKAFILVLKRCNEFYKDNIKELKPEKLYIAFKKIKVNPCMFLKIPDSLKNVHVTRRTTI